MLLLILHVCFIHVIIYIIYNNKNIFFFFFSIIKYNLKIKNNF